MSFAYFSRLSFNGLTVSLLEIFLFDIVFEGPVLCGDFVMINVTHDL
jgi:hypothetical protein